MSETTEAVRRAVGLAPAPITELELDVYPEQNNSNSDSSINDEVTDRLLQDLLNCPEFIAEQRLILLEFETARLNVEDKGERAPRQQQERPRSRRSSIGVKLTCPICLENLSSIRCSYIKMVTECGHIFCQSCIEGICEAADRTKEVALCPVCREEVGELRKVYF